MAAPSDETLPADASTTRPIDRVLAGDGAQPERIGRFLVVRTLGRGGAGIVYAAFDPELDRQVALKLLLPHADDGSGRLEREAQAMAKLAHPNVVAIHDVGRSASGVFIAMELVRGRSLDSWLAERPRTVSEIVDVFVQAGRGLAAAHAAGMVHRDFKPLNVLIDDEAGTHATGRVRVTDFGLARSGPASNDEAPPTSSDEIDGTGASMSMAGTPAFMAPEQWRGEATDARSDQFAFCVALWHAVHRAPPFVGESFVEIATAVTHGERRPPPREAVVPRWLRAALDRGLAIAPAERWPTMDALLAELARDRSRTRRLAAASTVVAIAIGAGAWLSASSTSTPCAGAGAQAAEVWNDARREQVRAAFATLAVPYAADASSTAIAALDDYAIAWAAMHTEACEATAVRREQSTDLLDRRMVCLAGHRTALRAVADVLVAADAKVAERTDALVTGLPELAECADAEALLAAVAPADAEAQAAVAEARDLITVSNVEDNAGKYDDALASATSAWAMAEPIGYGPLDAEAHMALATALQSLGRYDESVGERERAFYLAVEYGDEALAANAARSIVHTQSYFLRNDDAARQWEPHAFALARRADRDGPLEWSLILTMSTVEQARGDGAAGKSHAQQLVARYDAEPEKYRDRLLRALRSLGSAQEMLGEYAASLASYRRCAQISREIHGDHHPLYASAVANLGLGELNLGNFEEAGRYFAQALAIQEASLGSDHPDTADTLQKLAIVEYRNRDLDGARVHFEAAVAVLARRLDADHPDLAAARMNLANTLFRQGLTSDAGAAYAAALSAFDRAYGPDHPSTAVAHEGLARVAEAAGDNTTAAVHCERAIAVREKVDPRHPKLMSTLPECAKTMIAAGRIDAAVATAERGVALVDASDIATPGHRMESRFVLAQALWAAGTETARVDAEIRRARETVPAEGLERLAGSIDRWDASRPPRTIDRSSR